MRECNKDIKLVLSLFFVRFTVFESEVIGCRNHRLTSLTYEINNELRIHEEKKMLPHPAYHS